jgi:hypothetical protein
MFSANMAGWDRVLDLIIIFWSNEDQAFIAEVPESRGVPRP